MTNPYRLTVKQVSEWIREEVTGAENWTFFGEEQPGYNEGKNCWVAWIADEPNGQFSTTGWMDLTDLYQIRYWEPASDPSRITVYEDEAEQLEDLMREMRAVIFNHQGLQQTTENQSYQMRYAGSRKLGAADGASGIRGFEISVHVGRNEAYG